MINVKVDLSDLKRLSRDLKAVSERALPHASRNALNDAAFEARKLWQEQMKDKFILRNDWTTRTLNVQRAKGTNVATMESSVRSNQAYLVTQEYGGFDSGSVPTGVATGEGRGANPRKKLVRKPNKMGNISLGQRHRRGTRKQRNAVALHLAASSGKKFVFLELNKKKGLFRLSGGKKQPKLDMVWDTTSKSHRIRATPTLGPAIQRLERELPRIMTKALMDQLKRHKVFGY